jgi:hypothetical protein
MNIWKRRVAGAAFIVMAGASFGRQAVESVDQVRAYAALGGIDFNAVSSSGQVEVFADDDGGLWLNRWDVPGVPPPDGDTLPSAGEIDAILSAYHAQKEAQRLAAIQSGKPPERKKIENDFYGFVRTVLTAAGDPRMEETPTPKLGFEELTPLIESMYATDPMQAMRLTMLGFSIDAALKRYDATWWDTAIEHELSGP